MHGWACSSYSFGIPWDNFAKIKVARPVFIVPCRFLPSRSRLPDRPFHNFGDSKYVAQRFWTTYNSPIFWLWACKTVKRPVGLRRRWTCMTVLEVEATISQLVIILARMQLVVHEWAERERGLSPVLLRLVNETSRSETNSLENDLSSGVVF